MDDSREGKLKLLTELENRECIARIDSNGILLPAFKAHTLDYTSIPSIDINQEPSSNNETTKQSSKTSIKFNASTNISLKDILISNSSSRKEIKNER